MRGSQATECLGQAASIPYDQMLHRCAGQVATAAEVLGSWYFYSAPVFVAIVAFPEAVVVSPVACTVVIQASKRLGLPDRPAVAAMRTPDEITTTTQDE